MTLDKLVDYLGYKHNTSPKNFRMYAKQAILSWFKEQLPKEMPNSLHPTTIGISIGYNQAIEDILTNLTAKQGER
jgi:hypothetical protein